MYYSIHNAFKIIKKVWEKTSWKLETIGKETNDKAKIVSTTLHTENRKVDLLLKQIRLIIRPFGCF